MATEQTGNSRARALRPLASIGSRAATATLRPFTGAIGAVAEAGVSLERRAVDRVLEGRELERLLASDRLQEAVEQVLESDGVKRLVDTFFDSGLLDHFLDRLVASDGLWHMIDVIAASPAVTAAISQQGLGFADQVGDQVRTRSRKADDWLERAAQRLIRRQPGSPPAEPEPAA